MRRLLEIGQTGLVAVRLHPLRSVVCVIALVVVLVPYLAGIGLSKGLAEQAESSDPFGADLYVSGRQFGRPAPLPISAADHIRDIPGVKAVVPRRVGQVVLGKERVPAVLVGLP